ncbi:MAG: MarR family transcriptional regulator [Sulfobacillus benefaciens]|uniref:MarR family transcriptional regulator n=1 Tax=Sulfobacillus benefaciens TaxID=453960 RepID=A0A2T2WIX5_9FIRM|nr:MAG: MarR family transcriptional regulator [Sulfobacillus benefaciens]
MPIPVARHSLMREMNEMAVMTVVRQHGPVSRRRIAEVTGLTKSTVTVAVQRLFSKDVLMELGSVTAGPGRPERLLGLNPDAGYLLGASIDVAGFQLLLFDLEARVLDQKRGVFDAKASPNEVLEALAQAARLLRQQISARKYWGFGVSIPGIIAPSGTVIHAPNLKWKEVEAGEYLRRQLPGPLYVVNDAAAGAIAEYYFGNALTSEFLLYLSLGMGIGGGVMMGGNLLVGIHGAGTEVGHMVIDDNGPYCRCGRQGCFEAVASLRALTERAMRTRDVRDWVGLDHIIEAFNQDEPWARQALEETLHYLQQGITNLANIFDPDTIVLGGPLSRFGEYLRAQIERRVNQDMMIAGHRSIAVRLTRFNEFTSAFGAGAMALNTAVTTRA